MKLKLTFLAIFLLSLNIGCTQITVFNSHPNGLIYSDTTMAQLHHIVDSLNNKFGQCHFTNTFYSVSQGKGIYFSFKGKKNKIIKDIAQGLSYTEISQKYKPESEYKDLFLIKSEYINYKNSNVLEISTVSLTGGRGNSISFNDSQTIAHQLHQGSWLYTTYENTIYGFYITQTFTSQKLPEKYTRLINYSDCLVDTTSDIVFSNVRDYRKEEERDSLADKYGINNFFKFINNYPNQPAEPIRKENVSSKEYDAYWATWSEYNKAFNQWSHQRDSNVEANLSKHPQFMPLLISAVDSAIKYSIKGNQLEQYARKYLPGEKVLDLKRTYIVMGSCSMDSRPRTHAQEIAVLSAQSARWDVFLRAHLNIMNDRFDRVSDGSWAMAARKTYIKELELLDINVLDLVLGISLRVENTTPFHYYGSISRLGRALAETENTQAAEDAMLDIIADTALDDYNRVLIYYLFDNYNYYITNYEHKVANTQKLRIAVATMPPYIAQQIKIDNPVPADK